MATTLGKIVGYVSLVVWDVLCLFASYVLLCGILNFWHTASENLHNSAIIARRPRLVVAGAIASLSIQVFYVCASYNLRVMFWVEAISHEDFHKGGLISYLICCCTMMSGFVWTALRFWLSYFDIRWSAQQMDTKLLRYLDPLNQYKRDGSLRMAPVLKRVGSDEALDTDSDGSGEHHAVDATDCCHYLQCHNSQTSSFSDETLKQTYGNIQWLCKRAAVVNVLIVALTFVLAFINYSLIVAFFILSILCIAAFLLTLERLTPEFDDNIAIREEQRAFRRSLVVGFVGALIWFTAIVVDMQAMGGPQKDPGSSPTPFIIVAYVVCMYFLLISAFGSGFVPILYLIYCTDLVKRVDRHYTLAWLRPAVAKYRQLMKLLCNGFTHAIPPQMSMSSANGFDEFSIDSIQLSNSAQLPAEMTVKDVIADSDGLRAFSSHLFKEFSIESILCLIEVVRFRNMWNPESPALTKARSLDSGLMDASGSDLQQPSPRSHPRIEIRRVKSQTVDDRFDVRFPAEVESTTSAIVNKNTSIEAQFELLFQKYIRSDAQFGVNLPHGIHSKLLRKRNALKDTENTLPFAAMFEGTPHTAFDRVILELFNLLADSFWRFERTKDCKRLRKRHFARFRESQRTPNLTDKVSGSEKRYLHNVSAVGALTPSASRESLKGF